MGMGMDMDTLRGIDLVGGLCVFYVYVLGR